MTKPLIGLISNPHSRRNRSQLPAVQRIVANHPAIHHAVTAGMEQIPAALREFAAKGVNVLAINGGDGTTAHVFTELFEHRPFRAPPSIIILPGGTTNMNAGDAGMTGSLVKAVQRMAQWASGDSGQARRLLRPVLRVQAGNGASPAYGMFFGAGIIIRGIEYCHSNVHTLGIRNEIGPGIALLRSLWGMLRKEPRFAAPTPMRIGLDAHPDSATKDVILLLVSSLDRLFLGMRPWWGQEEAPLHCTWLEKPAPRLLRLFPSLLRGKPGAFATPERGYCSHNAQEIRLWMDAGYTLDGEIHEARTADGPLTISSAGVLEFMRIL